MEIEENTVAANAGVATMDDALKAQEAKKERLRQQRREHIARAREKQAIKRRLAEAVAEKKAEKVAEEVPQAPAAGKAEPDIHWFTEVDLNAKGGVANDFAAWYDDVSVDMLREDVRQLERDIEDGIFTGPKKRTALDTLKAKKTRLDLIVEGKPKLSPVQKDRVALSFKELSQRIKESMFSYDSHWQMTADPQEVARRMVNPCIKVTDDPIVGSFVKQRGIRMEDGMISQNHASIIYKHMAKLLGENPDVNLLRPVK